MKLRKKASNDAISKLANMNHVSMDEIKCEMKKVIDAAMNNPDPQKGQNSQNTLGIRPQVQRNSFMSYLNPSWKIKRGNRP